MQNSFGRQNQILNLFENPGNTEVWLCLKKQAHVFDVEISVAFLKIKMGAKSAQKCS
jgi:hypothetical protein